MIVHSDGVPVLFYFNSIRFDDGRTSSSTSCGCLGDLGSASEHHHCGQLFSSRGRQSARVYSELLMWRPRRLQELQYNRMLHTLNEPILLSYRIIHSIPKVQVLLHTINIPPTLYWICFQKLCNLRQVLCRQFHISSLQIFQSALHVSVEHARVNDDSSKQETK